MEIDRIPVRIVAGWLAAALWLDVGFAQDLVLDRSVFRSEIDTQSAGQGFGRSISASGSWATIGAPNINGGTGGVYLFRQDSPSRRKR